MAIRRNFTDFSLWDSALIADQIRENTGFNTFTAAVEEAHNVFHRMVGGDMGSTPTAPIDVVFYMHHVRVDGTRSMALYFFILGPLIL